METMPSNAKGRINLNQQNEELNALNIFYQPTMCNGLGTKVHWWVVNDEISIFAFLWTRFAFLKNSNDWNRRLIEDVQSV